MRARSLTESLRRVSGGGGDGGGAEPDGGASVGTVLFGQVVALSLSVAFDALAGFKLHDAPGGLGDLVIADPESACVGMSVAQVLAEANLALGGCGAALDAAALSDCAAAINEAYVDGEADGAAICSDLFAAGRTAAAR